MPGDDLFTKSEAQLIISRNYFRELLISDKNNQLDISIINSMIIASKYRDVLVGPKRAITEAIFLL